MNVTLRGKLQEILDTMIKEGYANTKSEAIRLAILSFGKEHINEDVLVKRKLDKIDREIGTGKRKVLNSKEALGVHTKYLK